MSDWRTPTVIAICHTIRDEKCYEDAPILADALEDGGYKDREMLNRLRNPGALSPPGTDFSIDVLRNVSLILGGEFADAVLWLDKFVDQLNEEAPPRGDDGGWYRPHHGFSYESLMQLLHNFAGGGDYYTFSGFDTPDLCYNRSDEMWQMYRLVMADDRVDLENRPGTPFSCSC